jgi:hypothetical protein
MNLASQARQTLLLNLLPQAKASGILFAQISAMSEKLPEGNTIRLQGRLTLDDAEIASDLDIIIIETFDPKTRELLRSGLFDIAKEQSLTSSTYQLVLTDHRKATILIKNSTLIGNRYSVFFIIIGELY